MLTRTQRVLVVEIALAASFSTFSTGISAIAAPRPAGPPLPSYSTVLEGTAFTRPVLRQLRSTPEGRAYLRRALRPLPTTLRRGLYLARPIRVRPVPATDEPVGGSSPVPLVLFTAFAAMGMAWAAAERVRRRGFRLPRFLERRR